MPFCEEYQIILGNPFTIFVQGSGYTERTWLRSERAAGEAVGQDLQGVDWGYVKSQISFRGPRSGCVQKLDQSLLVTAFSESHLGDVVQDREHAGAVEDTWIGLDRPLTTIYDRYR